MKRKLSIDELIDYKYGQFTEKSAFIMFIQDECEIRGMSAAETIKYVQLATKKFEHREKWIALIKEKDSSAELNADATFEQFLGNIERVNVAFEYDGGIGWFRFLDKGLNTLSKDGFEHYRGACIPAITSYEHLVYIPARIVPDEFIRQYVEQHTF